MFLRWAGSLPVELVSRTDIASHIDADSSATGPAGVSANGRFVVFSSTASNLVDGDRNGIADLFVHDLDTSPTERANVASDGSEADAPALFRAGVSDDGRYVVFSSGAATLTTEPTFGMVQVYRRDRVVGITQLLSGGGDGLPGSSSSTTGNLSADGRYSVFSSSAANLSPTLPAFHEQIYRHDAVSNTLELVSATAAAAPGSGRSARPQVSDDGRYVVFLSSASDLVAGDTNAGIDLFLRDMQLGTTQRVSVSSTGNQIMDLGSIEFYLSSASTWSAATAATSCSPLAQPPIRPIRTARRTSTGSIASPARRSGSATPSERLHRISTTCVRRFPPTANASRGGRMRVTTR